MTLTGSLYLREIADLGLADAAELSAQFDALPADAREDVQAVAKSLVDSGKLTKFQAAAVYQGKGKSLVYGDYVVLDRIGAGGMGQVFKARHCRMDRIVALKVMSTAALANPDAVKRFEREVKAAAKLSHPHVVTAYDAGAQDGVHYLVMEYVDGCDLSTLLKRQNRFSVRQACDFVAQAARGLAFAHAKGVVHRDIKPGNLLIGSDGVVKILDLGLARLDDAPGGAMAPGQAELTQAGAVMGTVDYMAPEQALNTRNADGKADVYSLGCTLYRLLTGLPMYGGETIVEKIVAHREHPIPPLRIARPDVPPAVDAIYTAMVAKRPDERPTMQQVADRLGSLNVPASGTSGIGLAALPRATGETTFVGAVPPAAPTIVAKALPPTAHAVPTAAPASHLPHAQHAPPAANAATRPKAPVRRRKSVMPMLLMVVAPAALAGVGGWYYVEQQRQAELAAANSTGENAAAEAVPEAVAMAPRPAPSIPAPVVERTTSEAFALPTTPPASMQFAASAAQADAKPPASLPAAGVDLLALVQLPQQSLTGRWARTATHLTGAGGLSVLQIPYTPPTNEYDLVLTGRVTSTGLKLGSLNIGLVAQGNQFHVRLGRTSCGLGDGNTYKAPYYVETPELPPETEFTAVCAVRNGEVRFDFNGTTRLEYRDAISRLLISRSWPMTRTDQLFLAIEGDDRWEITGWRLLPPSGGPTPTVAATMPQPTNDAPQAMTTAPQPPPGSATSAAAGAPLDLLARLQLPQNVVSGSWSRVGDEIEVAVSGVALSAIPAEVTGGYDLEAEFTRLAGNRSIGFFFPAGTTKAVYLFSLDDKYSGIPWIDEGRYGPTNGTRQELSIPVGERNRFALQVRFVDGEAQLIGRLNDREILTWRGKPNRLHTGGRDSDWNLPAQYAFGLGTTSSQVRFHRFQLRPVAGDAPPSTIPPAVATTASPPPGIVLPSLGPVPAISDVPPPVKFDPAVERSVAQAIFDRGGNVVVNVAEKRSRIKSAPLLPAADYYVETVSYGKLTVTEADLVLLQKLAGMKTLELGESSVNDQQFAALAPVKTLEVVALTRARNFRGAGLAHLTNSPYLRELRLAETGIDDAVSAQVLPQFRRLERLDVNRTNLTSAEFARGLANLRYINFEGTKVVDFSPLAGLGQLASLNIRQTPINDGSLATIPALPLLQTISCGDTAVTDAAFRYFERFPALTLLGFENTYVTDAGAAEFRTKKPGCRVTVRTRSGSPPNPGVLPPVPVGAPPITVATAAPGSAAAMFATSPSPPIERGPAPSADDQKTALAKIKEVYAGEYAAARQPDQKAALAATLLGVARQTTGDPASRYVLLTESRSLAIDGGNLNTLRDAILSIAKDFEVDEAATYVDGWNDYLKRPRDATTYRSLFDEATMLFDDAVQRARFDDAKRYGDFAGSTALRLRDQSIIRQTNERNAALVVRRKEWDAVKAAADVLAATPDDPAANATVGGYLAFHAGDWAQGLPMLVKSNDEVLPELARKSLAVPGGDVAAQVAMGDAWYDAAQVAKPPQKTDLLIGATYWYRLASPALSGLEKTRLDKRLADVAPALPQQKIPATPLTTGAAGATSDERPFMPVRNFGDPSP